MDPSSLNMQKTTRQKLYDQFMTAETDEELLAAQALYYKQKQARGLSSGKIGKSVRTDQNKGKIPNNRDHAPKLAQGNSAPNRTKPKYRQPSILAVGNILERNVSNLSVSSIPSSPSPKSFHSPSRPSCDRGFPAVFKHSAQEIAANVQFHRANSMWDHNQFINSTNSFTTTKPPKKRQKLSLFAQRMRSKKKNNDDDSKSSSSNQNASTSVIDQQITTQFNALKIPPAKLTNPMNASVSSSLPMRSNAVNPPKPVDQPKPQITNNREENVSFIHKLNAESNLLTESEINKIGSENVDFLGQYPESEILEMRQQLLSSLDPKLVALLTGKKVNDDTKNPNADHDTSINPPNISSTKSVQDKSAGNTRTVKKRNKIKMSFDDASDDDDDEERKGDSQSNTVRERDDGISNRSTSPKSAVIRKVKPLRSTKVAKSTKPSIHSKESKDSKPMNADRVDIKSNGKDSKLNQIKINDESQWEHPAKAVASTFDAASDANNDAPGPTQKEKMEWMEPVDVAKERQNYKENDTAPMMMGQNPLEFYRFGFDGKVLCDSNGVINTDTVNSLKQKVNKMDIDDPESECKGNQNGNGNGGNNKLDPYYMGLNHHGDEPLKPGYTVAELLHLCRSTVANQRSAAIKTIMHIVHRMRRGEYDQNGKDHSEYLWILLQQKEMVRLIVDILSIEKNISCIIPLLDTLRTLFVRPQSLKDLDHHQSKRENGFNLNPNHYSTTSSTDMLVFDGVHILCNTLPNPSPSELITNQNLIELHRDRNSKVKDHEKGSLRDKKKRENIRDNEMRDIWKCDVILAFIRETKLVQILGHILRDYIVPQFVGVHFNGNNAKEQQSHLYLHNVLPSWLDIIDSITRHHPECIELILNTRGFMRDLMQIIFGGNQRVKGVDGMESVDNKLSTIVVYQCKAISIVTAMCRMNRNAVHYLVTESPEKLSAFKSFIVDGLLHCDNAHKMALSIESLQLWRCCIKYGHDFNAFTEIHSILITALRPKANTFLFHIDDDGDGGGDQELFTLQQRQTRSVLNVIAILMEHLTPSNVVRLPTLTKVTWNQMAVLTEKVIQCLDSVLSDDKKWSPQNNSNGITESDWLCIGGLVHVMAAYYQSIQEQDDESVGQCFADLIQFTKGRVMMMTKKYLTTWSIPKQNGLLSSCLLNHHLWTLNNTMTVGGIDGDKNVCPLLDGLIGDIPTKNALIPHYEYRSKCDCILGIIKMAKSFVTLNRDTIRVLIQSRFIDAIGRVLMQITSKFFHFRLNRSLRALLFNEWRTEWLLAFEILTLCKLCTSGYTDIASLSAVNVHSAACVLLECLPPGYHHLGHQLLVKYICSRTYLPSLKRMAITSLRDNHDMYLMDGNLTTFYIESDISPFATSVTEVYTKRDLYCCKVFDRKIKNLCSRRHSVSNPSRIESLCAIPTMVPTFWMLQPMINLFKHKMPCNAVTDCLHFMFILSRCPQHHYWHNVSVWDLYRTLCTLFLCDSSLWSDDVNNALMTRMMQQCWRQIIDSNCNSNLHSNSNLNLPGTEWEEFYTKLLEHFESDSFGDDLFGKVILFQPRNRWNTRFSVALWSSMDSLGVLLRNQCPPNLRTKDSWKRYFVPFVSDNKIIDLMLQSLESSTFADKCNHSFLYLVAIVQIAHRIFGDRNDDDQQLYSRNMLQNVLNRCTRSVVVDVLNCKYECIGENTTSLDSGVSDENDVDLMTLTLLRQTLNIGKEDLVRTKFNRNRITAVKRDFAANASKLKLL